MAAQITRHGGKIEKYIGDAIMAVFGLPVQHEDDALRAVRAAAGMQAALRSVNEELSAHYGVELAMRTGVNTGEVVANDDPAANQKLATGDAVNVTARLEQAAPANEIYLGETTYRLVRDAVQVEAVEPLELKGKQERVPAYRLVSASGGDGNARRLDSPIVGREEELTAIDQALHEVSETGAARLITLIGDAGIGKSRLAREVIARAGASARVVRGRCLAYGDGITFWPLREMVSEAAGIHFEDAPDEARAKLAALLPDADVAARIASAIGLSGAAFPMHEISWAARKFFETLAVAGPAVALIDDIHWAEPAFLELIEHVLGAADKAPILLLCTARHDLLDKRPQWGEGDASLRLVLRPLSDAAAADVAANLLGSTGLAPDVVARIVTAAEGNPLYVEQILSMLVESKALELRDGRWVRTDDQRELAIPPTIKALLEARLGQLGVEERTAIEPASVIGLQFPSPAVASMTPERFRAGIDTHLQALTRKQFVHAVPMPDDDPIYRFHHHLVRETIYNGLLKRARATLHVDFVRWADKVNAERGRGLEFEEILGYHLEQAQRYLGELGPLDEKAREIGRDGSRRLASAGRRAFARGDMHAAASLLRRAVALLAETRSAPAAAPSRARRGAARGRPVRRRARCGRRGARQGRPGARPAHQGVGRARPPAPAPAQRRARQVGRRRARAHRRDDSRARARAGARRARQGVAAGRARAAEQRPARRGGGEHREGRQVRAARRRPAAGLAQRARPDAERALRADAGARGDRALRGARSPTTSPTARCRT